MKDYLSEPFDIRKALPEEYERLGRMTVEVYRQLPGMPAPEEQPAYYAMLMDVAARAAAPSIEILAAVAQDGTLLGGVTFIGDMRYYNSGGAAPSFTHSSGIRLLAVRPEARNLGIGRALTRECIRRAGELDAGRVLLHTTKAMEIAWGLYERMGFQRFPDLDFHQGDLAVFGFCLELTEGPG